MIRSITPCLLALFVLMFVTGCKEDPTTSPGTNNNGNGTDTPVPGAPCDSAANPSVGANGFVIAGGVYKNQVIALGTGNRDFEVNPDGTRTYFSIEDTASISSTQRATISLAINIHGYQPGIYPWDNLPDSLGSTVRLEIVQGGTHKVFRSVSGHIELDSLVSGAQAYGKFCGTMRDTLSGATVGIMSGRFAVGQ